MKPAQPDILTNLQHQWNHYFEHVGHDFSFLTRSLEIAPGCCFLLSRLGNYRRRRSLDQGECGLCHYLEPEAALNHPELLLDGQYHFHVNIYPTVQYVVIFSHPNHISMEANVVNYPRDLPLMYRTAEQAGITIFHNMRDAASSIPEHEHFQGLLFPAPIRNWPAEILAQNEAYQIRTMPAIPGANYVFSGPNPVPAVVSYVEALGDIPYTLGFLSQPSQIIVYPRRNEHSIHPQRRWGGTEMLGTIACRQEMYDQNDAEIRDALLTNYEHVLYPHGELMPVLPPC